MVKKMIKFDEVKIMELLNKEDYSGLRRLIESEVLIQTKTSDKKRETVIRNFLAIVKKYGKGGLRDITKKFFIVDNEAVYTNENFIIQIHVTPEEEELLKKHDLYNNSEEDFMRKLLKSVDVRWSPIKFDRDRFKVSKVNKDNIYRDMDLKYDISINYLKVAERLISMDNAIVEDNNHMYRFMEGDTTIIILGIRR